MLYTHDFSPHPRLSSLSFQRTDAGLLPPSTFVNKLARVLPKIRSPLEIFSLGIEHCVGNIREGILFLLEKIGQALKRHLDTSKTFRTHFAPQLPLSRAEISESIQAGLGCEISFALLITAKEPNSSECHDE